MLQIRAFWEESHIFLLYIVCLLSINCCYFPGEGDSCCYWTRVVYITTVKPIIIKLAPHLPPATVLTHPPYLEYPGSSHEGAFLPKTKTN